MKVPMLPLLGFLLMVAACKKDHSCETCPPSNAPISNNQPPVARAGADLVTVLPRDSMLLDGSASSDPDGKITAYAWARISGPASFQLVQKDSAKTMVRALVPGTYGFELTVVDDKGTQAKDTVQVIVSSATGFNRPPFARAGADQTISLPANSAALDGSASYDPDGTIVSWQWANISGPAVAPIDHPSASTTDVLQLVAGTYMFELTVTDNGGLQASDTVLVTVMATSSSVVCDNSSRPHIQARLIQVGTLSQLTGYLASASAGNKILFAGGFNGGAMSSRVDIYDLTTQRVSTAELSQARNSLAAVALGNKIFFAGGETGDGTWPVKTVDIYDVSTNTWSTAALSVAGSNITAAAVGNKVLFAGGDGGFTGARREYTVDIYDGATNSWSTASLAEAKRGWSSAVTVNNKVYISGGESWPDNPVPGSWFTSNRVDVYDNATNTWSASEMQEGKLGHAGVAVGNKIYWAGGSTGTYSSSVHASCLVEIRDVVTGNSSLQYLSAPASFYIDGGQNAVVKDNKILFCRHGSVPGYFDIYDITTNTWSIGVLPIDLVDASIISVDNTVYLAGGKVNGVFSDKIWKLEF